MKLLEDRSELKLEEELLAEEKTDEGEKELTDSLSPSTEDESSSVEESG